MLIRILLSGCCSVIFYSRKLSGFAIEKKIPKIKPTIMTSSSLGSHKNLTVTFMYGIIYVERLVQWPLCGFVVLLGNDVTIVDFSCPDN